MRAMFFSYKGGVGRTTILVNSALLMARQSGARIGIVDLDLEAPSMHVLLGVSPTPAQSILRSLADHNISIHPSRVVDFRAELGKAGRDAGPILGEGQVFLLPCLPDRRALARLSDDSNLQDVFTDLMEDFTRTFALDHLFVDSRPGYAFYSALAHQISDVVVLVFRLDEQNLLGIRDICSLFEKSQTRTVLIANEVPHLPLAREYRRRFESALGAEIDVVINLHEELLFGNVVPALKYRDDHELLRGYALVCTKLVEE